MAEYDYDVLVIGSGPSGQRAAIQSAKLHKRVAVIERKAVVGGVCVNTGTIPSKTMREAVLHLSGYRYRNLYGQSYTVKQNITIADLLFRTGYVVNNEIEVMAPSDDAQRRRADRRRGLVPRPAHRAIGRDRPPGPPRRHCRVDHPGRPAPTPAQTSTSRSTASGSSPATTSSTSNGCHGR